MEVATLDANDKVVLKPITPGRDFGTRIEVVDGLAATDRVIDSPPDWLAQGDLVRVATTESAEQNVAAQSSAKIAASASAQSIGK
jgi:hypothetical protein